MSKYIDLADQIISEATPSSPELPDTPGSVVKVRVPGYGVQHIVLGKDGLWRGPNVKAHASQIQEDADVVEVVA